MAYFYVIFTFLLGITQSLHIPSPRVDPFLNIQKITFPYHRDDATFDYGFYGVVIKFSENAQGIFARDEQVAGLALQAYEEARAVKENEINLSGMAVLLVGDEAYFNFIYDVLGGNEPLRQQLAACYLQVKDDIPDEKKKPRIKHEHSNQGNCGEIVAMQMWHMSHPGEEWPGSDEKAVATVAFWSDRHETINPCSGINVAYGWGCLQFVKKHGIKWVRKGFKEDTVQRMTSAEKDMIIGSHTVHDIWCKVGDNPNRQDEPPDAGPPGSPDEFPMDDWDEIMEEIQQ